MQPARDMWGLIASVLLLTAAPAFPQVSIRGAWIADVNGTPHIYVFKVKGDTVTGTYCSRCDEIDNITIIRNGRIAGDRLSFSLLSTEDGGRWRERKVEGSITSGSLVLRGAGPGKTEHRLVRGERPPRPAAAAGAPVPPPYVAPGPRTAAACSSGSGRIATS